VRQQRKIFHVPTPVNLQLVEFGKWFQALQGCRIDPAELKEASVQRKLHAIERLGSGLEMSKVKLPNRRASEAGVLRIPKGDYRFETGKSGEIDSGAFLHHSTIVQACECIQTLD